MPCTLRPARPADAAAAGPIAHDAFKAIAERHGFPPDFPNTGVATGLVEFMLSRDDVWGVVAEVDGRVVGSNFLWEGDAVAGIGPITVDPSHQDATVGRALMMAVMERAQQRPGRVGVRLVQAAYHTRSLSLYTKLGFEVREPLAVMQGHPPRVQVPGHAVRPGTEADLDAANALCRRVHGHDRAVELRHALQAGSFSVVEHDGRLSGYSTGVAFFSHTVGEGNEDLKALIGAAAEFSGPGFLLPMRNTALFGWCLAQGLRVVMPMTLMSVGAYSEPRGAFLPSILY